MRKKRAAVYGTGKSAGKVTAYIHENLADEMEIVCSYSSCAEAEALLLFGAIDCVIIPSAGKQIAALLKQHEALQPCEVYYVSADNVRHPDRKRFLMRVDFRKPWLAGFEYHVADHCNLRCKGCGHCASLFDEESFPAPEDYERDLRRLKKLFGGVGLIRLLGGEPLLNDALDWYIKITKRYFCDTELRIVTNGILLSQTNPRLIDAMRQGGVILDISLYPPVASAATDIRHFCEENGIEYHLMRVTEFYKRFSLDNQYDKQEAFASCGTAACHALYQGKLAPCIVPFSAEQLNKRFHLNLEITGWIDIHDREMSGEEINTRLSRPFDLCGHCNPVKEYYKWEQHGYHENRLEDWICTT